jgi:hypothetical protein
MAEITLILAGSATLIGSTIYALKNVKSVQSCCCSCDQNTPTTAEQRDDAENLSKFIKGLKEKFSPRKNKVKPRAVWASTNPLSVGPSQPPPPLPPLPRSMSVG